MSYDICLNDPVTGETIEFDYPHQIRGGTYAIGGTTEAWLSVTYNYSQWYQKDGVFPNQGKNKTGIWSISGLSGAESIPVLKTAISALENRNDDLTSEEIKDLEGHGITDYWLPTRKNAIKPLYQLLAFAHMRPDGIWMVE